MGGVKIEEPKAPRGAGRGEGVSPSPLEEGSGEGAVLLTIGTVYHSSKTVKRQSNSKK